MTSEIVISSVGEDPVLVEDETKRMIRVFFGGHRSFKTLPYPNKGDKVSVRFNVPPKPRDDCSYIFVVMVYALRKTTDGPIVNQTKGYGINTLQTGTFELPIDDPSDRDDKGNYITVGKLNVEVLNYRGEEKVLEDIIDPEILGDAYDERLKYIDVYDRLFKEPNVHNAVRIMFLKTFTTTLGLAPAHYFALVSWWDPPPAPSFVASLYVAAANFWGTQRDVIESNIEKLFEGALSDTDLYRTLRVVGETITLISTCCYYNGDYHNDTPAERFQFGTAQRLNQSDCEDHAQDNYTFANGIKRMDPATKGLSGLIKLLNMYEFVMVTGVATNVSMIRGLVGDESGKGDENYICHVWTMGIPRSLMYEKTGEPRFNDDLNPATGRLAQWGSLLLEGTNWTSPLQRRVRSFMRR
jgi:hypothetical protein